MRAADRRLRRVAAALALVVVGLHVASVLRDAAKQLYYLQMPTPLPALFLIAALLVLTGILLVYQGFDPLPVYVGGIALMTGFVVGYGVWHTALDHGAFWPGRRAAPHSDPAIPTILRHLRNEPLALASKLVEVPLIGVLVVLARREYRDRRD